MAEGQYKFSVGLDDKQLEMDIKSASKLFDNLVKEAQKAGAKIDQSFKNPFEELTKKGVPKIDTSSVAEATTQFNGLNVATQQLVRELPAASMGLNTFFLAVSNNLPIFADQIKRINDENKTLASQGKPTVSVLKQIGTSLLSWQTALVLGVTALSMYGKEIGKWVVSLFKGKDALDAIKDAERDLHEARMTGAVDAQEEATNLRLMVSAMQDATLSMDERKTAMQSLQNMYPEYFGNLTEEQMLYGDLTTSVETLVDRMVKLATARNAVDQIVKNEQNKALLEGTEGYDAFAAANTAFEATGRKKTKRVLVSNGLWMEAKTSEYLAYEKAQKELLKNLKDGNEQQRALFDEIADGYDKNVDSYQKAIEESNKKLTESAQGAVTGPGLKAAEAEAKRKEAEAKRLEQEAERMRTQAFNATAKLAKDAVDARTQSIIAAMEEGLEKEKAQINAEYDAKAREITEREDELKKLQGGKLTERQTVDFASLRASNEDMRANAIADAEKKAANEANDARNEALKDLADYYIQYGTIQEKILNTTQKYATLIANAQNEGQRMALEAERDALLAEYQVAASDWAKELVNKTTDELKKMLAAIESEAKLKEAAFNAMDTSSSKDAAEYNKQITELNAKIKMLKTQLGEADKSVDGDNWAEATQAFQSIANSASQAASSLSDFDNGVSRLLQSVAQLSSLAISVSSSIVGLQEAFKDTAEEVSALEKASAIFAVISAAIQAVSFIVDIFNSNAEAANNAAEALAEYERELERINNAAISKTYTNIFGTDEYGEFSARLKEVTKLQKEVFNIRNSHISGDVLGDQNAVFTADYRNGWQKFWGSGDDNIKTTKVSSFYNNGILDTEKLRAYYNANKDALTDYDREYIENLLHHAELLQENLDAITGYLQDKFGQMGQHISDALVDAFENGTDAAEAMGDAMSNILEDIAKDMAYASFIQPLLDEANKQIEELNKEKAAGLSDEEYLARLMEIGADLVNQAALSEEAYKAYMTAVKEAGEDAGLELFNGGDIGGRNTGIARASQESVDELNGRATAIQSHTYAIMQSQQQLTQDAADMLRLLANIDANTRDLHFIRMDIARMRGDINSMATQGISMR